MHVDDRQALLGKELGLEPGRDQAEERRSEQHPGDHLGDHLRLPERLHQETDQPAGRQDDGELQEESDRELEIRQGCIPSGGRLRTPHTIELGPSRQCAFPGKESGPEPSRAFRLSALDPGLLRGIIAPQSAASESDPVPPAGAAMNSEHMG